jgi:hypothetical protein
VQAWFDRSLAHRSPNVWNAQIDEGGCVKRIVSLAVSTLLAVGLIAVPGTGAAAEDPHESAPSQVGTQLEAPAADETAPQGDVTVDFAVKCFSYDGTPVGRITGANNAAAAVELEITYYGGTERHVPSVPAGAEIDETVPLDDGRGLTIQVFADGAEVLSEHQFVNCSPATSPAAGTAEARFTFECRGSAVAHISINNRIPEPTDLRIAFQQGAVVHDYELGALTTLSRNFGLTDDVANDVRISIDGTDIYFAEFVADCLDTAPAVSLQSQCDDLDGDNTALTLVNPNRRPVDVSIDSWVPSGPSKSSDVTVPAFGTTVVPFLIPEDQQRRFSVSYFSGIYEYQLLSRTVVRDCFEEWIDTRPAWVVGENRVGTTLTAELRHWSPAPDTVTYQWLRNGITIPGATASTYELTGADTGDHLSVSIVAGKAGYQSVTHTSSSPGPVVLAPVPTFSGQAAIGKTLTAVPGTWEPTPTSFDYEWYRNGSWISLATPTYQLTDADAGQTITVRVSALIPDRGWVSSTSKPLTIGGVLTSKTPTISGTARAGKTLVASPGLWGPAPVTLKYQWLRNGVAIPQATGASYVLTTSDAGRSISVQVTGSKSGHSTVTQHSSSVTVDRILTVGTPTISGTPAVGSTLKVTPGAWGPAPVNLTYQWYSSGWKIPMATGSTYKLTSTDAGRTIIVKVTGSKSGYTTVWKNSAGKVIEKTFRMSTPKIAGTPRVGSTLSVASGISGVPAGATLRYQWYRNGAAISGATGPTYRLTASDRGRSIAVKVRAIKTGYTSLALTSASVRIL